MNLDRAKGRCACPVVLRLLRVGAHGSDQIAVDFELYLPESWTESRARRREARILDELQFKTKPELCFVRVHTTHDDGIALALREPVWLVAEWPEEGEKPSKFVLTTLPRRMSKKQIVRLLKKRWRTERMYEDLKGELGLDHQ